MAKKPLTVKGFFIRENGETVPMESLSEEELLEIRKMWIRRQEKVMSAYYSQHPDEFEALPEATPEDWERYYQMFPEKRGIKKAPPLFSEGVSIGL